MKRDKAIETIKELPREFDLDDLIERLVFVEKVEKGLKQLDEGKTVPHDEVEIGNIHLNIDRILTLEEVSNAHQYMEDNKAKGKIVVEV